MYTGEINFKMYSIFKEKKKQPEYSIASHLEFCVERFSPTASSFVSTV